MKRISVFLSKNQVEELDRLSDSTGIKRSEHIRAAITKYLKEAREQEAREGANNG